VCQFVLKICIPILYAKVSRKQFLLVDAGWEEWQSISLGSAGSWYYYFSEPFYSFAAASKGLIISCKAIIVD